MAAMPIFTKKSMLRGSMYDELLNLAANGGWEIFDVGNEGHVFHSMGVDGNSRMEFKLLPYMLAVSPTNDIRTSNYANPKLSLIRNFNKVTKLWDAYHGRTDFSLNFFKSGGVSGTSYQDPLDPRTMVDVYYYITKDVIVWVTVLPNYVTTGTWNSFFIIGKPTESFLQERTVGNYSGMVVAQSGGALNNVAKSIACYDAPKNYMQLNDITAENVTVLEVSATPDLDGQFALGDILYSGANWGYRGRLKYFYTVQSPGSIDGDIITVDTGSGIEKYMKVSIFHSSTSFRHSLFPGLTYAIAIRIE